MRGAIILLQHGGLASTAGFEPAARVPVFGRAAGVAMAEMAAPPTDPGRYAGQGAGPEPQNEIEVDPAVVGPGNRTVVAGAVSLAFSETGTFGPIHRAKPSANFAGLVSDSAREFEVLPVVASGFSVNHVQVENCESNQREDSVRESSSGCSSDLAPGQRAASKASSSCSSGDSRNPREGILRTRNSGNGSGLATPPIGQPKDFHFASTLRLGASNSKVTDSGRQTHDEVGASRQDAVVCKADRGLAVTNWPRRVAQGHGADGSFYGAPQGRSGGRRSASPAAGYAPSSGADRGRDQDATAAECRAAGLRPRSGSETGHSDRPVWPEALTRRGVGEAGGGRERSGREGDPRSGSGMDREGDPNGLEGKNPGAISGAISASRPEVNPHSTGTEIRGEIGSTSRPEIRPCDVELRTGDRRSGVAEPPGVGLLVPRSAEWRAAPAVAGAIRTEPILASSHAIPAVRSDGRVPSTARFAFEIPAARTTDFYWPAEIRHAERITESVRLDAGLWAGAERGGKAAIGHRPDFGVRPDTRRTIFAAYFGADLRPDVSKSAVNSSRFLAPTLPENARGILAGNLSADQVARENIHAGKHADKNRLASPTASGLDLDRAVDLSCGNFSNSRETANAFGEKCSAPVLPFGPIRKPKNAGIFGQFSESLCAADLIRAGDLDFLNFHEMPRFGEFSSPAMAPSFGHVRTTKHSGISSPDVKSHCTAGTNAPFNEVMIFEALKLNGFFTPLARLQKHIRGGELFSVSSQFGKNHCPASISAPFRGGSIFGLLKLREFFCRGLGVEKHIRRGEVFGTSCPGPQTMGFLGSRSASYQGDGKPFIFSEFSSILSDSFAVSIYIRKAKLSGISCPGASREFSGVCASEGFAARPVSAVNSGECLTEINDEKLPDFSKAISRPASSKAITGINAGALPDLAIPDLSESITGINAQSSREFAPINSRDAFTEINVRSGDSPFEQTRLADSSIRAFPVRGGPHTGRVFASARAPP